MPPKKKLNLYDVGDWKTKYLNERLKGTFIGKKKYKGISQNTYNDYKRKLEQIGVYEYVISKDIGEFSQKDWKDALLYLIENESAIFSNKNMINSHFTVFQNYFLWYSGDTIDLQSILENIDVDAEGHFRKYNENTVISRNKLYEILNGSNFNSLRGGVAFLLAFEGLTIDEIIHIKEKEDINEEDNCIFVNRNTERVRLYIPTETMKWLTKLKNEYLEVDRGNSKNKKAEVNFNSSYLIKDSWGNTDVPVKYVTFNSMVDQFINANKIPVEKRIVDARNFGIIDNTMRLNAYFEDFDINLDNNIYYGIVYKFGKTSQYTRDSYKNMFLNFVKSLNTEKYESLKQELLEEEITKQITENINENFLKKSNLTVLSKIRQQEFDDGDIEDLNNDYFGDIDENIFGEEGKRKLIIHIKKERRNIFIKKCKAYFKQKYGYYFCEVCGDVLTDKYGAIAEKYIEAHHKVPLNELTEKTKIYIKDIAMVCSNCHSMIHIKCPCYSIGELKDIINSVKINI